MTLFKQIGAVVAMNIRSLPQRVATSLVVVIGIAGVVAVLISVLRCPPALHARYRAPASRIARSCCTVARRRKSEATCRATKRSP